MVTGSAAEVSELQSEVPSAAAAEVVLDHRSVQRLVISGEGVQRICSEWLMFRTVPYTPSLDMRSPWFQDDRSSSISKDLSCIDLDD